MKRIHPKHLGLTTATLIGSLTLLAVPASALTARTAASTTGSSANTPARLQLIISRGNNEITRRLSTLNTLNTKINAAVKLSTGDKDSLSGEVSSEISNLTSLKTKLDADTDVPTASTDAQSIISDYRVYALVVPKVNLVKTADDQQVTEGKLTTLSGKLQARLTADQTAGKDVTSLQTDLTDLNSQVSAAQTISSGIESKVINLQPSDYDSDHTVLSGDRDQLKTAKSDIQTALTDAKTIVNGLKNL